MAVLPPEKAFRPPGVDAAGELGVLRRLDLTLARTGAYLSGGAKWRDLAQSEASAGGGPGSCDLGRGKVMICAHPENAEAGPEGHQGTAGPVWTEFALCPVLLRPGHAGASEDRGIDRAAAISEARGRASWIARARRTDRACCGTKGGFAGRLAGERPAASGQVRRRALGPGQTCLDLAARCGEAPGSLALGCWWRWLGLETWWLDLGIAGMDKCRHGMDNESVDE